MSAASPPGEALPSTVPARGWRDELRGRLVAARAAIADRFDAGESIDRLLAAQTAAVDEAVVAAWGALVPADAGLELIATGGYGRGEQYPHSDVDLLVLGEPSAQQAAAEARSRDEEFLAQQSAAWQAQDTSTPVYRPRAVNE